MELLWELLMEVISNLILCVKTLLTAQSTWFYQTGMLIIRLSSLLHFEYQVSSSFVILNQYLYFFLLQKNTMETPVWNWTHDHWHFSIKISLFPPHQPIKKGPYSPLPFMYIYTHIWLNIFSCFWHISWYIFFWTSSISFKGNFCIAKSLVSCNNWIIKKKEIFKSEHWMLCYKLYCFTSIIAVGG